MVESDGVTRVIEFLRSYRLRELQLQSTGRRYCIQTACASSPNIAYLVSA